RPAGSGHSRAARPWLGPAPDPAPRGGPGAAAPRGTQWPFPGARPDDGDVHRPQTSSARTKPVVPWWRTSTQPFATWATRSRSTPRATLKRTAESSFGAARTVAG